MLVRVGEKGRPAFRLRPGESGISIFDTRVVEPELMPNEILGEFREGSILIEIDVATIKRLGLLVVSIEGAGSLPERLRQSHVEIRPGQVMPRSEFKRQLKELERHVH